MAEGGARTGLQPQGRREAVPTAVGSRENAVCGASWGAGPGLACPAVTPALSPAPQEQSFCCVTSLSVPLNTRAITHRVSEPFQGHVC